MHHITVITREAWGSAGVKINFGLPHSLFPTRFYQRKYYCKEKKVTSLNTLNFFGNEQMMFF